MTTSTVYDTFSYSYVTTSVISHDTKGDSVRGDGCLVMNLSALAVRDNTEDPVDRTTLDLFDDVKGSVLMPSLFFFGFPTNLLNIVVFFKHGLRQRINLCLFCLSTVDLLYLSFAFLMYVDQLRPGADVFTKSYFDTATVGRFITNNHLLGCFGLGWASQFVSAFIASERCFCVLWPLRAGTLLKTRTVGIVLLVAIVVITAGRFAVTEKFRVVCLVDVVTGVTSHVLTVSAYYAQNRGLVDALDGVVYGLVVPITTCTVVAVTTSVTAFMLRKSVQFRRESTSTSTSSSLPQRELELTRMLIYLSVQFIFFNLPNILLRVSVPFLPELSASGKWANLLFFMIGVVEVCAGFNASVNVLVYYFTGSKYRRTVHVMLGHLRIGGGRKRGDFVDKTVSSTVSTVS